MYSRVLPQQIGDQLGSVSHERNNFVIRHPRWSNHSNHPAQRASVVRRRHNGKVCQLRIVVLVADRDRYPSRFATTTEQLAEFLASLCERDQLAHVVDAGELGLARENRSLTEHDCVVIRFERTIEKLIAFLDKDVKKIGCVARRADVAESVTERRSNLTQRESRESLVQNACHLRNRRIGDFAAYIDKDRAHGTS